MNIESLGSVTDVSPLKLETGGGLTSLEKSNSFVSILNQQLTETNSALMTSEAHLRRIAAGDSSNLHQAMIAMEEASIRLNLVVQIRNKLVDGYHEVLKMQL
ncbi:MAG: flagellar hook-basal body complex protein FliE [Gammaproteobacteria bacterium]|nr:flagellar hook-basal body complex protein FliE [Gammaproteobacteria bacterium]